MTEGRVGNSIVGLRTSDDSTATARHRYVPHNPAKLDLVNCCMGGRAESGFFGSPRSDWTKGWSTCVLTVGYGLQVSLTARCHHPQSIKRDCGDMTYLTLRLEVEAWAFIVDSIRSDTYSTRPKCPVQIFRPATFGKNRMKCEPDQGPVSGRKSAIYAIILPAHFGFDKGFVFYFSLRSGTKA
jgi:hypothetical protein